MESKEPKKLDFIFKNQPVKARIYLEDGEAKVQISGLDLSESFSISELDELSAMFAELTMGAVAYE